MLERDARRSFARALTRENHTLKRALTDPQLFSGIGNAYSDEILHRARLSPLKLTRSLTDDEIARLHEATRATLREWIERLRAEAGERVPGEGHRVPREMAVHGRFRQPCPVCGAPVQRIVYAENECNYCARCQTGGRLLADRVAVAAAERRLAATVGSTRISAAYSESRQSPRALRPTSPDLPDSNQQM